MPPTLDQYARHAKLFGTECVEETASTRLEPEQMVRLRVELDEVERDRRSSRGFSIGKTRRRAASETASAVLQLAAEGLVPTAIADKLGVSDAYVRKALRAP